ncbi:neurogenic locus notch homolog protein 1-like [Paramacrobiotus metropolitanus]|uniref:neurogenic locus notch homolog protein 1-like n=1 Tax=Paramacrobiotus metropolitanus TaxID=2943436 RepID=UPI00244657BD|nr:neurogenic locus notch homolog protein 1-like [Paramacrobiotus metropolitanus]
MRKTRTMWAIQWIAVLFVGFYGASGQMLNQATGALLSCDANPCKNGGACVTDVRNGSKYCQCPESHVGQYCQHVNPCYTGRATTRRCFNGGNCTVEFPGTSYLSTAVNPRFRCQCPIGFSASLCEIPIQNVCDAAPCENGGTCNLLSLSSYTCECRHGYRGPNCNKEDYCASYPCSNGGTCKSLDDGFQCQCRKGYKGVKCEEDINECAGISPCQQGAACVNTYGSYRCNCPRGYTGQDCDQVFVACRPSPCKNGGRCYVDQLDRYNMRCECPTGFTGKYCEVNIDDCVSNQCRNGGKCIDGVNSYTCQCPPQFTGFYCESDVDECQQIPTPCKNGATCVNRHGGYSCICVNGFQGDNCESNINDCSPTVCLNGGTCHDRISSYYCECPVGKTGLLCHLDDACVPNPCHGAAECTTNIVDGTYECSCPRGFNGTNCNQDIDECSMADNICEHKGKCRNTLGSFVCDCAKGYTGSRCEENINECAGNPCQNDGTCLDKIGEYKCACMPGFKGVNCEIEINECKSSPCLNGGICRDSVNGYKCTCPIGFAGQNCQIKKTNCNESPCRNGGTCLPSGLVRCRCPAGFAGDYCEENVNDCASQPCVHGTCIDGVNNFTCSCKAGYTGPRCQDRVSDCANAPCLNSGQCEDRVGTFVCRCPLGFTGERCEQRSWATDPAASACRPNPCKNNGECLIDPNTYRPGEFRCQCPEGFSGRVCENIQPKVPEFKCPRADCAAKRQNGKCDEECNNIDCEYDGQECSLRLNPWLNCTLKTRAPCWNYFRNGRCDQECNIPECMFDGFDCGAPLGVCDPVYDAYCSKNYGNGQCDEGCNTEACDYDGLDCDKDPPKPVEGILIVIVKTSIDSFRNNSPAFLRKLGRALRSIASIKKDEQGNDQIMPWSLNGGIAINPEQTTAGGVGTAVYIQLDNRKCTNDCMPNADAAAAFLAAAEQRGELNLGLPVYSVQSQADRMVTEPPGVNQNLYWLLLIFVIAIVFGGYCVVTHHNQRKRVRAATWFPEGLFDNKTGSTAVLNEHLTLPKSQADLKKSPQQGFHFSDASTVNSYCEEAEPVHNKRRKGNDDLQQRSWTHSGFDGGELKGRSDVYALTPPMQYGEDGGCGVDANAKGPGGLTPLMLATMRGNGPDNDEEHLADDMAASNIIRDLLYQGADIDAQSEKDGETALHLAARFSRPDVARLLLDNNADVNARDNAGRTPLLTAVAADSMPVFAVLRQHRKIDWTARAYDGTTALIIAVRLESNDMLDELLKIEHIDINAADDNKRTALHWAASVNNHQGCKQLLYKNAKVDVQDENGQTPLYLAAKEGSHETAQLLLDHKASPELTDDMEKTPRDIAQERHHFKVVELLDSHKEIALSPPQNFQKNIFGHYHSLNLATVVKYTHPKGVGRKGFGTTLMQHPDTGKRMKRAPLDLSLVQPPPHYHDAALYGATGGHFAPEMNWKGAANLGHSIPDLKHEFYGQPGPMNVKYPPHLMHAHNSVPMTGYNKYSTPVNANEGYLNSSPESPGHWSSSPASSDWSDGMQSPQSRLAQQSMVASTASNPAYFITANGMPADSQPLNYL